MSAYLEKSTMAIGLEKVSFYSNPKEGQCWRMFKLVYSCSHFTCSKSFNLGFSSSWTEITSRCANWFLRGRGAEIKLLSTGLLEKHLLHWSCESLWLCGSQQTVENSLRDGNTRPPYLSPEKSVWVKNQQLEPDMEQLTGSKLEKEYCILSPCLFNFYAEYIMQNARLDES